MSSCALIDVGLQKWQVNFVLMAASAVWPISHFTALGRGTGGLRGPGTCIAMMALGAPWLPVWPQLGINTVHMKLIDLRCQRLNYKT